MGERELVKVKSDSPAHPNGYYTQFRDCMKPGDVEYIESNIGEIDGDPGEGIQVDPGDPPAAPIKTKKRK
jgi:hypothetical protein